MLDIATQLHGAVGAVCPIDGVSVGDPVDKSTWSIHFTPTAGADQVQAAMSAMAAFRYQPGAIATAVPATQTLRFGGTTYAMPELGRLNLLVSIANHAVLQGVQANDLRWYDPATDFTWPAANGERVPMDAPTLVQFALTVSKAA